jgi:hypothetical protein
MVGVSSSFVVSSLWVACQIQDIPPSVLCSSFPKRIFPPKKALKLRDFPRKSTKYAVSNVAIHYCFFALDNIAELCLSVAMNIN